MIFAFYYFFQITLFNNKECRLLDYNQIEQKCILTITIQEVQFTIKDNLQGQKIQPEASDFRFTKQDVVYAAMTKIGAREGKGQMFLLSFYLKNQQVFTFGPIEEEYYDSTLSFVENNYVQVTQRSMNVLGQNWGDVAVDNRLISFAQLDHQNEGESVIDDSDEEYNPGDSQVSEENQEIEDEDDIDDSPCPNPVFQIPINTVTSYTKIGQKDIQVELQHIDGLKSTLYLKSATFGFPNTEECQETFNLLQRYVTIEDENRVFFLENVQCYSPSGRYHLIINRDGIKLSSSKEINLQIDNILRIVIVEHEQGFIFTIQSSKNQSTEFISFLITQKQLNSYLYIKEEERDQYKQILRQDGLTKQCQLDSVPACNVIALLFSNLYNNGSVRFTMSPYVVSQINNAPVEQNNCLDNDNSSSIECIYKRPTKTAHLYWLSNFVIIEPQDISLLAYKDIRVVRVSKDDKNSGATVYARMQIITNSGIKYLFTRIIPSQANLVLQFLRNRKFNIKLEDILQQELLDEQKDDEYIQGDDEDTEDWEESEESESQKQADDQYEYEATQSEESSGYQEQSSDKSQQEVFQQKLIQQKKPQQERKPRKEKIVYREIQLSPDDLDIQLPQVSQM